MRIVNSELNDIQAIFKLYEDCTAYQKTKFQKHWPIFDFSLIETEIKEGRHWKIIENNIITCIFQLLIMTH